jgi:predicted nucleic acid-binding protein
MIDVVVDASVASKWFLTESDSALAEHLLAADVRLHAPDLLRVEVANTFWKHMIKGSIDRTLWEFARPRLERSIEHWHASSLFLQDALAMACDSAHPIYDFIYLALAQHLGARLVTADRRFLGKAPTGRVIALEDWRPQREFESAP